MAPGKWLSVAAPLRIEGLWCRVTTLLRPAHCVYCAGLGWNCVVRLAPPSKPSMAQVSPSHGTSLHSLRRRFHPHMAQVSTPIGAGFTLTWHRFPTPLPWRIVPLHIIGHFCGLRRSADRGITHFRPKTRNGTFLTPAATVYVQLECRQRPISCTYTAGECCQGPNPEVYVQLEWRQRAISCTYTGRGGGAGPQRGWTWSRGQVDQVQGVRRFPATSNAFLGEFRVVRCNDCNE